MKKIFWLAFAGIIISSCYRDNKEDLYQNFTTDGCDTTTVTYTDVIDPICVNNCATSGCHSSSSRQSGLDLSNYNDLMTIAKDGRLIDRITGNGPIMPPGGPLPNCDISKIETWVLDGAPNN